ncbi:dedicator of cytokinesis domain containing protein [Entamoeba histolytica KU27]|uniref:Dedicator of cytokinesis domain containing protein n=1 Tax=Entamoeba histolytica KU27 TaxID=885311 RepID=M2RIT4_ENTHI|nr:dedicator of cytokinesis domain containing protein [Entamoeba histolytica KU27]
MSGKGKKPLTEKTEVMKKHSSLVNSGEVEQPTIGNVFVQYDTEGFNKLDTEQIRNYLQHEKKLFLSDDEIKELMFEVVLHSDKVPKTEFGTLDSNINEKRDELMNKSNENNTPTQQHELWLLSEKEVIPQSALVFDAGDIEVDKEEKPRRIKPFTTGDYPGSDQKAEDRAAIDTIFAKTTVVKRKKFEFILSKPKVQEMKHIEAKEKDEPNVDYLREDGPIPDPRIIYSNTFGNLDESFKPVDEANELCDRYDVQLTNTYDKQIQLFIAEVNKIGLIEPNDNLPTEPLFGVFSIYNADETDPNKAKLTENFYIDINTNEQRASIRELSCDDALNNDLNKFCIGLKQNIAEKSHLKCVLMVYKIAESDQQTARDLYVAGGKDSKIKIKQQNKIFTQLNKQYLGIGFVDFNELVNGKIKGNNLPIFREDIDCPKDVISLFDTEKTGKLKKMIIEWSINIKVFDKKNDKKKYRLLDPSGFDLKIGNSKSIILRQIEDFTSLQDEGFYTDYVNNVYIYPTEFVVPAKERKKCNFVITVYIREDDDQFHRDNHLGVFYSTTSNENSFKKSQKTSVGSGGKNDTFMDEIKAKLPTKLTSQHHLLFVIQDVSLDNNGIDDKTDKNEQKEKKTFFASLPFLEKGKLIDDKEYFLPIFSGQPFEGYLTSTYKPLVESTDKVKPGLKIRLKFMTSVNVQDETLHNFLGAVNEASFKERDGGNNNGRTMIDMERMIEKTLDEMRIKTDKKTLIHHFPFIMQSLFNIFKNVKDSANILKYVLSVVECVMKDDTSNQKRPKILVSYIDYYFEKPNKGSKPIFSALMQSLLKLFTEISEYDFQSSKESQKLHTISILKNSWFFYELIVKSLTLEMDSSGLLNNPSSLKFFRSHISSSDEYASFSKTLLKFVDVHSCVMRRVIGIATEKGNNDLFNYIFTANSHFALFLTDLLRIYRRCVILEAIDRYLSIVASVYDPISSTYFSPVDNDFRYVAPNNLFFPKSNNKEEIAQSMNGRQAAELLRIDFLSILSSFPYFVEVSVPVVTPTKINQIQCSLNQYTSIISQRHIFSNIFCRNMLLLLSRSTKTAKYALSVLLKKVIMLDTDSRYQNPIIKQSIAEMFFCVVLYLVEQEKMPTAIWGNENTQFNDTEIEDFFIIFIWILKNINKNMLQYYIVSETSAHIASFFEIIKHCLIILTKDTIASRNIEEDVKFKRNTIIESFKDDTSLSTQNSMKSKSINSHSHNNSSSISIEKSLKDKLNQKSYTHWELVKDDVSLVILDVIELAFNGLFGRENWLMQNLTNIISTTMFKITFTGHYANLFLRFIRRLLTSRGNYIFKENISFGFNLLKSTISLCDNEDYELRQAATSVLYLFAKTNYQVNGDTLSSRVYAISSIAEQNKNNYSIISKAIEVLPEWAQLDATAVSQNHSTNEVEIKNSNDNENKHKNDSIKRKKELIESIDNERGGDGRWWAKKRMLIYLKRRWEKSNETVQLIDQILDKIQDSVDKEGKVGELRRKASDQAINILTLFRNITANVAIETDYKKFVEWQMKKLNELKEELDIFEKIYNELMSVGGSMGGSVSDYRIVESKVIDLCNDRQHVLESEQKAKSVGVIKKEEFMKEHETQREVIAEEFSLICKRLAEGKDMQNTAQKAIEEFNKLKNKAGNAHDKMRVLDGANGGTNVWEVLFGQWKSILPKTTEIIQRIIDLQIKLKESERERIDIQEKVFGELAAAEEYVKVAAFEVDALDVLSFEGDDVKEMKELAESLVRDWPAIEKSVEASKKWYGNGINEGIRRNEKIMLSGLNVKIENISKAKLMEALKKFKSKDKEERENQNRRNEYAQLYTIVIDLAKRGDVEPSAQVNEISKKIKEIENTHTKNLQSQCKQQIDEIIKIVEQKPKYSILLPGIESKEQAKEQNKQEVVVVEKFEEELLLLKNEISKMFNYMKEHQKLIDEHVGEDVIFDNIFSFAQEYSRVPSVHLSWYKTLSEKQGERGNYVEAGICAVHFVSYIYKYLKDKIPLLNENYLTEITTDFLDYEKPLLRTDLEELSEQSLVTWVFKGIDSFQQANLHSFAIALCYFIIPYFSANHDFRKLAQTHKRINELYSYMVDPNNRYIGYFYLVSFFGTFANAGKKYVYRSTLRIKEFQELLIKMHPQGQILESKKEPDPSKAQISVINVSPFNIGGDSTKGGSDFPHTSTFCSEIRVVLDGAKPDVLEKACKKRTILKLKHSFPSVLEREEVIEQTNMMLTPIQSSTDDINCKVEQLATLLEKREELRLSTLQVLLKGILSAEVNGGPGAICKTFLNKEGLDKKLYPAEDVQKLFDVMQNLLDNCKEGLAIHKGQMKAEAAGLQNIFELGFLQLERTVKECKVLVDEYVKNENSK